MAIDIHGVPCNMPHPAADQIGNATGNLIFENTVGEN